MSTKPYQFINTCIRKWNMLITINDYQVKIAARMFLVSHTFHVTDTTKGKCCATVDGCLSQTWPYENEDIKVWVYFNFSHSKVMPIEFFLNYQHLLTGLPTFTMLGYLTCLCFNLTMSDLFHCNKQSNILQFVTMQSIVV